MRNAGNMHAAHVTPVDDVRRTVDAHRDLGVMTGNAVRSHGNTQRTQMTQARNAAKMVRGNTVRTQGSTHGSRKRPADNTEKRTAPRVTTPANAAAMMAGNAGSNDGRQCGQQ